MPDRGGAPLLDPGNTLNGFNPGHIHQGPLGDAVYEAIYENGGMPVHMNGRTSMRPGVLPRY